MSFDLNLVMDSFPLLIVGAGITIQITAISVALGMVIGLFVGIARISTITPLRALAAVYIDFLRGTPLLVQIFLIYFALPVILDQRVDPFLAAITACVVHTLLRFSVPVFRLLIMGRWRPAVPWAFPGPRPCDILLCRRPSRMLFLLWVMSLSLC